MHIAIKVGVLRYYWKAIYSIRFKTLKHTISCYATLLFSAQKMTSLSKEEFFCRIAIIILNVVLQERTEPKTTS
jgi:hypothetical protein